MTQVAKMKGRSPNSADSQSSFLLFMILLGPLPTRTLSLCGLREVHLPVGGDGPTPGCVAF